jgi:hypothetical protein
LSGRTAYDLFVSATREAATSETVGLSMEQREAIEQFAYLLLTCKVHI